MASIGIADKTTLDSVKTDTTAIKSDTTSIKADTKNILAQFPISGGTDYKSMQGFIARAFTFNTSSYVEALNISGSGLLGSILQFPQGTDSMGSLIIEIDGVKIFEGDFSRYAPASLNLMLKFERSLVIKHSTSSSQRKLTTNIVYYLD